MRFFSASPFCMAACEVGGLQHYFLSMVCGEAGCLHTEMARVGVESRGWAENLCSPPCRQQSLSQRLVMS